jgi:cysteine desulfurase
VELTRCNSGKVARTPNTSNIIFECIEGEALVIALDLKGISVSTGAACSSGAVEPSHVLTAMGLTASQARASIRFSLGKQTTEDDLDFVLDQAPAAVAKLRELSPVWKKAVSSF